MSAVDAGRADPEPATPDPDDVAPPAYPAEHPGEYPDDQADDERILREVPPHY